MRTEAEIAKAFLCMDCGFDTCNTEFYMVHNELWLSAGMNTRSGMLCIGCLEKRIGRTLTDNDFTDCLLNQWVKQRIEPASFRLLERMVGRLTASRLMAETPVIDMDLRRALTEEILKGKQAS